MKNNAAMEDHWGHLTEDVLYDLMKAALGRFNEAHLKEETKETNMTEDERNLDLMVAELESENRLMRARNERLQQELNAAADDRNQLKEALERILTVSRVAFRDGVSERVGEVGETKSVQRQATGLL
jgi:hypothetical protein